MDEEDWLCFESRLTQFLNQTPFGQAQLCLDHLLHSIFDRVFLQDPNAKKINVQDTDFQWKVWSVDSILNFLSSLNLTFDEKSNTLSFNGTSAVLIKKLAKCKKALDSLDTKISSFLLKSSSNDPVHIPRKALFGPNKIRAFAGLTGSCNYAIGFAEAQGGRPTMEDEIVVLGMGPNVSPNEDYFAVFDGHGGQEASTFAAVNLHKEFAKHLRKSDKPTNESILKCLKEAFHDTNQSMCANYDMRAGTCALVTFISNNRVFVANLGDSRAVLGLKNGSFLRVSEDHKPSSPREKSRITAIPRGFVSDEIIPRVQGVLSVSRALGDKQLQPFISPEPDLFSFELNNDCAYLVLGCDGVWDKVDDSDLSQFAQTSKTPYELANQILISAETKGSKDNISVVVIFLADRKDWKPNTITKAPEITSILS